MTRRDSHDQKLISKAVYAGSFYDDNPSTLRSQLDYWFAQAVIPEYTEKIKCIISPHAGYEYSGFCAAHAYKLMRKQQYKTAIIIHPSHQRAGFAFSVNQYEQYQTPLGNLNLRKDWADKLIQAGSAVIDHSYHQQEHSMEVQLPFIAYLDLDIRILPIMMGNQNPKVGLALATALWELILTEPDDTIVIISTDLSHYHSQSIATKKDRQLIDLLVANATNEFWIQIKNSSIEACGFGGLLVMLHLATLWGKCSFSELLYTDSGDKTRDKTQVVGYLSAALIQSGELYV